MYIILTIVDRPFLKKSIFTLTWMPESGFKIRIKLGYKF